MNDMLLLLDRNQRVVGVLLLSWFCSAISSIFKQTIRILVLTLLTPFKLCRQYSGHNEGNSMRSYLMPLSWSGPSACHKQINSGYQKVIRWMISNLCSQTRRTGGGVKCGLLRIYRSLLYGRMKRWLLIHPARAHFPILPFDRFQPEQGLNGKKSQTHSIRGLGFFTSSIWATWMTARVLCYLSTNWSIKVLESLTISARWSVKHRQMAKHLQWPRVIQIHLSFMTSQTQTPNPGHERCSVSVQPASWSLIHLLRNSCGNN